MIFIVNEESRIGSKEEVNRLKKASALFTKKRAAEAEPTSVGRRTISTEVRTGLIAQGRRSQPPM